MKFFFILSLGRSGTKFLANLLNKDSKAIVYHEPFKDDYQLLPLAYYKPNSYILKKSLEQRFICLLDKVPKNIELYGEVNSLLRYHVDWIKMKFDPTMIHIVRDGRDVVRSAYNRSVYSIESSHLPIFPINDETIEEEWLSYSRFQKLSWYWTHTNEFLSQKIEGVVKFENIITSYDYFYKHILKPTGIMVSFELYNEMIKKPINTQRTQLVRTLFKNAFFPKKRIEITPLPHWKNWDNNLTEQFWNICGETMNKFNYTK